MHVWVKVGQFWHEQLPVAGKIKLQQASLEARDVGSLLREGRDANSFSGEAEK